MADGFNYTPPNRTDYPMGPEDQPDLGPSKYVPQTGYQVPGVSGPAAPQQSPTGFNSYQQSMGLPAQQNFDGISKAILARQSPYVSFGAHGWLQDNHPGIAGALDNVFLTAANIQQGETVGQNIGAVAHGLIAGRMEKQQHDMQQALLPVELAQRQFAYNKNYLDVMKDRAQIDEASNNAYMNKQRGDNFARLADQANSPYSKTQVGTDGKMYGIRKDNGSMEAIPGQDDQDMTGDPGGPPQGKFPVPGTAGKLNMTELYGRAAKGDQSAIDTLNYYSKVQGNVQGTKTGAADLANQPKQLADAYEKEIGNTLGKRPEASSYKAWRSAQIAGGINDPHFDPSKIPSLESQQAEYDQKATNFANYKASGLSRRGVPYDPKSQYTAPKAQGKSASAQVPGTSPQAPAQGQPDLNAALDSVFGPAKK